MCASKPRFIIVVTAFKPTSSSVGPNSLTVAGVDCDLRCQRSTRSDTHDTMFLFLFTNGMENAIGYTKYYYLSIGQMNSYLLGYCLIVLLCMTCGLVSAGLESNQIYYITYIFLPRSRFSLGRSCESWDLSIKHRLAR